MTTTTEEEEEEGGQAKKNPKAYQKIHPIFTAGPTAAAPTLENISYLPKTTTSQMKRLQKLKEVTPNNDYGLIHRSSDWMGLHTLVVM